MMVRIARSGSWWRYSTLALIVLATCIIYLPALGNGLLAWDDESYVTNNPLIYSFNLKEIFSQAVMGNYHPLTILTIAIEYHLFGLHEAGYHAVNLLLHLLNVVLVYHLVARLSGTPGVALVAALLFGVHPLHVESVAWVAELKDLLYTSFFLASCILYLHYLKAQEKKFYIFALLLFLCALLAKAMAASLPVVLLLLDHFAGRKMKVKTWLEKAPFFLLALALGVVAILAQKSAGATEVSYYTFPQRIAFACYSFIAYLYKLVLPLQLSAYYPYPVPNGADLPARYYAYVIGVVGLAAAVIYSLRFSRKLFFGLGFFAVTIGLVLQLLPVGGAVMADRYSYIPSIGVAYLAGEGFDVVWTRRQRIPALIVLAVVALCLSLQTYARCAVWANDLTLWNDVIRQYQTVPLAYYNRGLALRKENRTDEALSDFSKALELNPRHVKAYHERASALADQNRYDEALRDYGMAIELNPTADAYYNSRARVLIRQNKVEEALQDYNKAIELSPETATAYYNRGTLLASQKQPRQALVDFGKAIELNAGYIEAYINRGNILRDENRTDEALRDYAKALELKADHPIAYFNRATLFMNQKAYAEAIRDFTEAIRLNADYAKAYYNRGLTEYYAGQKEAACADLKRAASLGYQPATAAWQQICFRLP